MKKKQFITIIIMIAVITPIVFILFGNREFWDAEKKDNLNMTKHQEEEMENLTETGEKNEDLNVGAGFMEAGKKIELTDYIELPIEDFLRETGAPLYQKEDNENVWISEDNVLWVGTVNSRVVYIGISQLIGNEEIKQKINREGYPYTIAGISLNDEMSELYDTVLKNTSYGWGESGCYCYTGLDLCKLGIEKLTLTEMGTVDGIEADFDTSLKESAENLEYIWEEKVLYKEGTRNDKLVVCERPELETQKNDIWQENMDKTVVCIKYPSIEIPDNPVMTQNINNLILETVEQIEDKTYKKTDENIIVQVEYMITYMTSKFISISFRVDVISNAMKEPLWQFCNINIAENGKGATLADVGITKEDIITACDAFQKSFDIVLDIKGFLEKYNADWSQYRILPTECLIYVYALNEDTGLPDEDDVYSVRLIKY